MWGFHATKECTPIDSWHTKSLVVDPKRTKITMTWDEPTVTNESNEDPVTIDSSLSEITTKQDLKEEEKIRVTTPDYETETCNSAEAGNNDFLTIVKKAYAASDRDKELGKIMAKMERGENLKKKEFATVFSLLRARNHYH